MQDDGEGPRAEIDYDPVKQGARAKLKPVRPPPGPPAQEKHVPRQSVVAPKVAFDVFRKIDEEAAAQGVPVQRSFKPRGLVDVRELDEKKKHRASVKIAMKFAVPGSKAYEETKREQESMQEELFGDMEELMHEIEQDAL